MINKIDDLNKLMDVYIKINNSYNSDFKKEYLKVLDGEIYNCFKDSDKFKELKIKKELNKHSEYVVWFIHASPNSSSTQVILNTGFETFYMTDYNPGNISSENNLYETFEYLPEIKTSLIKEKDIDELNDYYKSSFIYDNEKIDFIIKCDVDNNLIYYYEIERETNNNIDF